MASLLACIFYCIGVLDACFSVLLRVLGPVLIVAANGLIGFVSYEYLAVLVPMFMEPQLGWFPTCAIVCFGLFLLTNILFNYWACILTRPGYPGDHLEPFEETLEVGRQPRIRRFCKKCRVPKPERTHHCSVCNRCVMKMDHHCPWINNCVGFYNYRYFLLFLLYLAAGCLLVACSCLLPLYQRNGRGFRLPGTHMLLFVFVLCLSILLALSLFLFWHTYLVGSNQTTIEFYCNRFDAREAAREGHVWRNPYNLGCIANYEQVFGMSRHWASWLLPTMRAPPGDGVEFPSTSSDVMHQV
uniref:Palmitoyltransferase n=1 Tax=Calcidiscus leptoporus TaxID=127549 RepID=A0A7S0J2K7_9EUKA|mmetsp:Transcript_34555/g.80967  ORF Transcript_34555/g.80967 Transcript_34555/m.80967 type:complete len:299 (+) Transcript_34555:99-995(+)